MYEYAKVAWKTKCPEADVGFVANRKQMLAEGWEEVDRAPWPLHYPGGVCQMRRQKEGGMTPKDKGMLYELLHEYGPKPLIHALAIEGYGQAAAIHLRRLTQELDPSYEDWIPDVSSSPLVIPQGELLEFEEPKPYGLWNGERWFVDGKGRVFYTSYLGIARIEIGSACEPDIWHIMQIDSNGKPIECP